MLTGALSRASRSTRTRILIERLPITRRVVDRFVAGEEIHDAAAVAARLNEQGRLVSLDVLGEDITDLDGARRTMHSYLALLAALDEGDLADSSDVSVKLSALGQGLPRLGPQVALDHARQICAIAQDAGCTVTLDMEDHTTVDSTLEIGDELRRDFPGTGVVLQSNLYRTRSDLEDLGRTAARVRLVKGAYREPASVAHQRKADVDDAYRRDLATLMASSCYPMVATHDPTMLDHARVVAAAQARPASRWEIQMLYGVRTDLKTLSNQRGDQLRVYVPFGTDWYAYFMRRLAERPANVGFFLRALLRG